MSACPETNIPFKYCTEFYHSNNDSPPGQLNPKGITDTKYQQHNLLLSKLTMTGKYFFLIN
ncbi:hypothetical Protein YC6258_02909 [Gynuella sunshinyii YC6258]|uniref:Uncharacterized protein n=1 Tax=Gynuella sunshinyii YC6258 TaxID=1445510 RepID=A0A0C5VJV0_9GAMM|nr:hypothetical Protein YC6258_02909 [Gynuella sunshinyii YC6258]